MRQKVTLNLRYYFVNFDSYFWRYLDILEMISLKLNFFLGHPVYISIKLHRSVICVCPVQSFGSQAAVLFIQT